MKSAPVRAQATGTVSRTHYPRLDGLRGVAVLLVLMEHFTYSDIIRGWSPGMIGVRLFFVLSGLLITSILLDERMQQQNRGRQALAFYWRRFVRLSPAMFAAVGILYVLDVASMRDSWWVHLLYLSNIQIAQVGYWIPAGHFWSLSVEEQFYLLWFPLVVLLPRRLLLPAIAVFILGAPVYRLLIPFGMNEFYNVLLPGQVDSLAWGALIAVSRHNASMNWVFRWLGDRRVLWASLIAMVLFSNPFINHNFIAWPLTPAIISICGAAMVVSCVEAKDRTFGWLAHPVIMHVGAISYGIYVYHYFVPQVLIVQVPDFSAWLGSSVWTKIVRTVVWAGLTFAIAELSWRLLERPMLRLKNLVRPRMSGSRESTAGGQFVSDAERTD